MFGARTLMLTLGDGTVTLLLGTAAALASFHTLIGPRGKAFFKSAWLPASRRDRLHVTL